MGVIQYQHNFTRNFSFLSLIRCSSIYLYIKLPPRTVLLITFLIIVKTLLILNEKLLLRGVHKTIIRGAIIN